MKAYVLHDIGQLNYEEYDTPSLSTGEVLLKVEAAGICGSDIPRIFKNGTYHFPTIPGHEFSGRAVKFADDIPMNLRYKLEGRTLGVFPLIPCMKCDCCKERKYEMCSSYGYLGSRCDGGFAEYVRVPVKNLLPLPEGVSAECAAMLEPMSVAAHAMRRINPVAGEKTAVYGLGTIGLFTVMFLLTVVGAENIYVIGNKESQKRRAESLGIPKENYFDFNDDIPAADVSFECVGRSEVVSRVIDNAKPGGRVMLVGNPASDMSFSQAVYWKILRRQLTVLGTWNSSFTGDDDDDWHYVLRTIPILKERFDISPEMFITHRFEAADLPRGLGIMRDKTEDFVKIMSIWN